MKSDSKIALLAVGALAFLLARKKGVAGCGNVGKSDFRNLYNMPYSTFDLLVESGIVWIEDFDYKGGEVYSWYEPEYEEVYIKNKAYIDRLGKDKSIEKRASRGPLFRAFKVYPAELVDKVKEVFF